MTSTTATTQINVRIDRGLKSAGDASLLAAGITPTEAIRALWELAVRLKGAPAALAETLFPQDEEEASAQARKREDLARCAIEGQGIIEKWRVESGISCEKADADVISDDDLYGEALYERYRERWSL